MSSRSIVLFAGMVFIILTAFITGSCSSDDTGAVSCSGVSITFAQANAVIQASCAKNSNCHGSGSSEGPGPLVTYAQIYAARGEIYSVVSSGEMPKDGDLSTDEKSTIICWIEGGAGEQ